MAHSVDVQGDNAVDNDFYGKKTKNKKEENIKKESFSQADMVTWVPEVENGFAKVNTAPGIGIDLVEDVEKKFPFKRRKINTRLHVDGSIVDQ